MCFIVTTGAKSPRGAKREPAEKTRGAGRLRPFLLNGESPTEVSGNGRSDRMGVLTIGFLVAQG